MTDRLKEQLSAFLDGELPEAETALLLKRLERDDDLRGALSRYSLIGAVLRDEDDVPAARQVAARVSAAIAREPAMAEGRRLAPLQRWRRPLAGLGIAASVAAAALLMTQQMQVAAGPEASGPVLAATVPVAIESVGELPAVLPLEDEPASVAYTTPPAAPATRRLPQAQFANYLVAHSGYASPLVQRSLVTGLIVAPDPANEAEPLPLQGDRAQ